MDPKEMEMYENKGKDNKFNESKWILRINA
jgi:hypothetical protein